MSTPVASACPHRVLRWTAAESDIGAVLGVVSEVGLAAVRVGPSVESLLDEVAQQWRGTRLNQSNCGEHDLLNRALVELAGGRPGDVGHPLDLGGTEFQRDVWHALQCIPRGETRTYSEVANDIGSRSSVRAVANACGANPLALVIPCHRVIRSDGGLGGYRWGIDVKRALLQLEQR